VHTWTDGDRGHVIVVYVSHYVAIAYTSQLLWVIFHKKL